jgi:glycosyltransferase involved in cell wall biosynthesis
MTNPLVSILIPAYNSQEWISETIESALAQTWPRKEIIVVDDGSLDQTGAIARKFAAKNVRVETQPNQGAAAARNLAFSICQGDYVQWLDADDILHPDKIEQQVRRLNEGLSPRTLISGAWGYFKYRRSKATFTPSALWADLSPAEWLVRKMGSNLHMQTDNWLVSRELTEAAGAWDVNLWRDNDGEYFCRVILASDGVCFVPEAKSYYRAAGFKSVSYIGGSSKKLESLCRSMKLHIGYLRSLEDSDRTRAASQVYIRNWLHEFYPYRPDLAQELRKATEELGGRFEEPRLSWKYQWMVNCLGWGPARRMQLLLPKLRASLAIGWDRLMFQLEK